MEQTLKRPSAANGVIGNGFVSRWFFYFLRRNKTGERGASAPWFLPIDESVLFIHETRG